MLGGAKFASEVSTTSVEVLDTKTRSWKPADPLKVGSSFHASVLIPKEWFEGKGLNCLLLNQRIKLSQGITLSFTDFCTMSTQVPNGHMICPSGAEPGTVCFLMCSPGISFMFGLLVHINMKSLATLHLGNKNFEDNF